MKSLSRTHVAAVNACVSIEKRRVISGDANGFQGESNDHVAEKMIVNQFDQTIVDSQNLRLVHDAVAEYAGAAGRAGLASTARSLRDLGASATGARPSQFNAAVRPSAESVTGGD